jgi:LacI family transcriptional regulator
MIDVAKAAGVSQKTVSRVLNDEPHVKPAVRDRVMHAVKSLNYHPNVNAQGLVQRRSYLIGLVYENPSPSYVVELQQGALERLAGERYRLIVLPVSSVSQNAEKLIPLLRSTALDAVILPPPACDHKDILDGLDAIGMRYARVAPTRYEDLGPRTLMDDVAAAQEIAEHVIALGHRDIAIIKGDPTHMSSIARMQGYSRALSAADIRIRLDWIEEGRFTFESGMAAAKRLLDRKDRPTAILAQNDDMAVGAIMVARDLGIDVPGQLSVVGFDDSEVSRITWPRLTTVRQPVFEMTRDATDMLLAKLEGKECDAVRVHHHELLIRQSTAPPPGR